MALLLWREAVYYDASTTMSEAVRTLLQRSTEAAREASRESEREADAGFLWDFWYPAARSAEIRGQKLGKALLSTLPRPERTGERGHLTPFEAGEHGRQAQAKRLVVTHFSDELDQEWIRAQAAEAFGGPVELAQEGAVYTL